jgi:hypothetical protein
MTFRSTGYQLPRLVKRVRLLLEARSAEVFSIIAVVSWRDNNPDNQTSRSELHFCPVELLLKLERSQPSLLYRSIVKGK